MAQTKTQKILRYVLYGLVGAGVLGVVTYGFIIRPLQVRQQKQNFDKAEASLDTLAAQIQQTIGKADETKKEKTCGRANLKSEEGPLICSVSATLLYKQKDSVASSALMMTLVSDNNKKLRIGSGISKGASFFPTSERRGQQTFYQDFPEQTKPTCTYSYNYPATLREFDTSEENFKIEMTCGEPAIKEFFPLKD